MEEFEKLKAHATRDATRSHRVADLRRRLITTRICTAHVLIATQYAIAEVEGEIDGLMTESDEFIDQIDAYTAIRQLWKRKRVNEERAREARVLLAQVNRHVWRCDAILEHMRTRFARQVSEALAKNLMTHGPLSRAPTD